VNRVLGCCYPSGAVCTLRAVNTLIILISYRERFALLDQACKPLLHFFFY